MEFEDLQRQWRVEAGGPLSEDERDRLLNDVRKQTSKMERSTYFRDLREIIAAIIVLIGFVVMWPRFTATWISTIGTVIVIGWIIVIVVSLLWLRPRSIPFDSPASEFLRQKVQWCDGQIWLLKNAGLWYVLPMIVGAMLIVWSKAKPQNLLGLSIYTFVVILFGVFLTIINGRASKGQIKQLRDDLDRLREEL